jgi:hypothetical protein
LREEGNYSITVWQGGVKQLTREISVYPLSSTSTGGGVVKPNTSVSVEAARTAAQVAVVAQTQLESSAIPSQIDLQWVIVLLIIVASLIWFLNTIVRS